MQPYQHLSTMVDLHRADLLAERQRDRLADQARAGTTGTWGLLAILGQVIGERGGRPRRQQDIVPARPMAEAVVQIG